MNLSFTWINILILFGALQALLFSILLCFQKSPGSKFLASFVFIFAYNGFETVNWSVNLNHMFFDLAAYVIIFAAGPSLFFYTKSVLAPAQTIHRRQVLLHFAPFIFQFVMRLIAIGYHLLFVNGVIHEEAVFLRAISFTWTKAEPFSMLIFSAYVIAAIVHYNSVSTTPIWHFATQAKKKMEWRWIQSLLIWSATVAVLWLLTLLSQFLPSAQGPEYYPIELFLVVFMYWLVLNGYHKVRVIRSQKNESEAMNISTVEALEYFQTLSTVMEQRKLYLDPKLNVAKVSQETRIPAKVISYVLNQHRQTSFNDFVNGYRVSEVCKMLGDESASQRFTISAMALECGFNSQATFQRAFKHKTGVSPRDYIGQVVGHSA